MFVTNSEKNGPRAFLDRLRYSDHSENLTNRKIWLFWFEAVLKKIFQLRRKKNCWSKKKIIIFFRKSQKFCIENPIEKFWKNRKIPKKNKSFFLRPTKIFFIEVEFFFGVQFRCRKVISFDWWGFQSDLSRVGGPKRSVDHFFPNLSRTCWFWGSLDILPCKVWLSGF